jgi:flagellar biosynthesis protein FlhG
VTRGEPVVSGGGLSGGGLAAGQVENPGRLPGAPLAEAFGLGKLGTRLFGFRREGVERPRARVVCVASGKGGTGKSILSTNLCYLRAQRGERVLLVDFDAGLANAHLLLGLAPEYDLSHVVQGQVRAEDALVPGPGGLHLLSGGVGRHILANPTRRELDRLFKALRPLEERFDLIVIDHGAGVSYATVAHLAAANVMLLVTNHEVTALSDGYALYKRALLANPSIRTGLVLNRAPDETRALSAWERFQSASQRFLGHAPELVGWVPYDPAVLTSVEQRVPVAMLQPDAPASRAIEGIANWAPIDQSQGARPFFERARAALR